MMDIERSQLLTKITLYSGELTKQRLSLWYKNRHLKQLLVLHDGHWEITIAHKEHFALRWANKAKVVVVV